MKTLALTLASTALLAFSINAANNKRVTDYAQLFPDAPAVTVSATAFEPVLEKPEFYLEFPPLIVIDPPFEYTASDIDCIARNMYYEAGVESYEGKIAVAQVVEQRMLDNRWSDSACGNVFWPSQFSWTLDEEKRYATPAGTLWRMSQVAAEDFARGMRIENFDVRFFYADWMETPPRWAHDSLLVAQIGQHIFFENDYRP